MTIGKWNHYLKYEDHSPNHSGLYFEIFFPFLLSYLYPLYTPSQSLMDYISVDSPHCPNFPMFLFVQNVTFFRKKKKHPKCSFLFNVFLFCCFILLIFLNFTQLCVCMYICAYEHHDFSVVESVLSCCHVVPRNWTQVITWHPDWWCASILTVPVWLLQTGLSRFALWLVPMWDMWVSFKLHGDSFPCLPVWFK